MFIEFCLAVVLPIIILALSNISEAALYSLSAGHVEILAKSGRRSGQILKELKADINKPITVILTLNTIANTMGAAIAGAAAAGLFGKQYLGLFSVIFTFTILVSRKSFPKRSASPIARSWGHGSLIR